ncbi:hypothetical protein BP6252_05136 [Coleophoma cylindrospora]|uniref:UBX domain-containing protein n=1 Tax=Coleophoma cylindrospora TaxID=1849047 RepID=A0A3D8RSP9_9HELO|nr:hypothetical protein BP6252_05136 [Coleophoma cylindrospora]
MASHVVVTDSTFKRAQIKVTPGKYMTEVLEEACKKLGRNSTNYGLKNNSKQIDLSQTFRLTGLSAGAKLELVVTSRSPSVVSVALQLPESLAAGVPGGRLVDKVPSDTTLWLVLRKFETVGGTNLNITGRGIAQTESGASGAGRIYYETPVLNLAGREVSTFTDLQKTLGQFGVSGGSILLRLTFRKTDTPLEEAMAEIQQYFKTSDEPAEQPAPSSSTESAPAPAPEVESVTEAVSKIAAPSSDAPESSSTKSVTPTKRSAPEDESKSSGPRPMTVFAAPSGDTPKAALQPHNDMDYEPTVQHAKQHQEVLKTHTMNKRLPSYAEQQKQEEEKAARLAKINEVIIQVRFPDQTRVENRYTATDTSLTLYNSIAAVLRVDQPFKLVSFQFGKPLAIPKDEKKLLIRDIGLDGRVLLNFLWEDGVSEEVRKGKCLKAEYIQEAKELPVPVVQTIEEPASQSLDKGKGKETDKKENGGEKKNKMMSKILAGLSKK